jgi:hypothetical protein
MVLWVIHRKMDQRSVKPREVMAVMGSVTLMNL